MDDDAILAGLDDEPDAFAVFYRRHVAAVRDHFLRLTQNPELASDLCAETFAAALDGAHRFDPARGPAVAWLYGIAQRLLAQAQWRGAAEDRARRRLGMAPLDLTGSALARAGGEAIGDDFVRDLEEELVAAARYRAGRRRRRVRLPRPSRRSVGVALLGAASVAAIAVLAAFALGRGDDDRAAVERRAAAPPGGCTSTLAVAPELLERVAVLGRPAEGGHPLPRPALASVREWQRQLDAIFSDGARFWGGGEEVEFWAVPVVPRPAMDCGSATGVCIVAITSGGRANSHCVLDKADLRAGTWRIGPLFSDRAVVFGVVPGDVTGARVTIGSRHADVDARDNVIGGVVPFPYRSGADTRVDLIHRPATPKPAVGVVAAGGDANEVKSTLGAGGYETLPRITPGVKGQETVQVYWRPGLTRKLDAIDVAELVSAEALVRIGDEERVPRPVLETDAPVVVVVGSG